MAKAEAKRRNREKGLFLMLGSWEPGEPVKVSDYDRRSALTVTLYRPVIQRAVNNDLSLVSLNLMYDEANRRDVPLGSVEGVPSYLNEYYTYAGQAKSRAFSFDAGESGAAIKDTLAHQSATHKRFTDGLRLAENFAEMIGSNIANTYEGPNGTVVVKREVYPNRPDRAVVPV